MQRDEPQIELRPRSALEAADLGFAMVRAWWRPLAASWLALVLPVAAAISLALVEYPWIAVLVLWWLRPLFARVPLHVLSRKVFGRPAGLADTLRSLPELLRSDLLLSLTLLRFSPARTLLQPVLQLEQLRGRQRRARSAVLASRDVGAAMGLMTVGAHISAGVILGVFTGIELLIPEEVSWEFGSLFTPLFDDVRMGWTALLLPGLYMVGVSVVEPLLVAAGFAMYLNRRVFLEGWDIEIALRRLSERARPATAASARAAAAALIATVSLSLAFAGGARADVVEVAEFDRFEGAAACAADDAQSANACADALMATGEFGGTRIVEWWVPRESEAEDEDEEDGRAFLESLGPIVAAIVEFLAWATLAVVVLALAVALARSLEGSRRDPGVAATRPTRLFGLELEPDSLPDDLVGAARAAWRGGDFIGAMSLLYRGALVHLIEARDLRIPESATEYECVELVRTSESGETPGVFAELTHAWVGTRYATSPPANEAFEALCAGFARVFVAAEPHAASSDTPAESGEPS